MNLNEYQNLRIKHSFSRNFTYKESKLEFLYICNHGNHTFLSQTYRIVGPLGEKLDFFSPLRFEPKREFDNEISKLNPHSIRASERNLKDNYLIHGQKHHRLFLFGAENLNLTLGSFTRLLISPPGGN